MKKRVILILCVLAVLLTAVICLPFARKIDTTVTATEYRFDDPAYAVEHTVVICGHDTRNLLGYGVFEGTFAVSGFESGQEGWTFRVSFSDKKSLGTAFSRRPSGEACTRDLFHLLADRDWSDFAGLIMEVSDKADHSSSGSCFKRTRIGIVSFNRRSPDSLIKTINRPDAKRPACCYVPGFNYF